MPSVPTPQRPLILIYRGATPAMKNSTRVSLAIDEKGEKYVSSVGRSAEIHKWMARAKGEISSQMERQGFKCVPSPWRIGAWVQIGFYLAIKSKSMITKQDADNAYTSIQETWGESVVMENDRQVVDFHVSEMTIRNRPTLYSVAYLWAIDPQKAFEPNYCVDQFIEVYNKYKDKKVWELLQSNPALSISPLQPRLHLKDKRL